MTTPILSPNPKFDYGLDYAGGLLYTYETGTTTPKATWTDSSKLTPNSNPVVLDSMGRADVWIDTTYGKYRFKLTDADGIVLFTKDEIGLLDTPVSSGLVTGSLIFLPISSPLSGTLECNGSVILRADYADLFSVIGEMYGPGDGTSTFSIPDFRGQFLRIWDHGAGVDPDAATRTDRGDGTTGDYVGTKQADIFGSHIHTSQTYYHPSANMILGAGVDSGADTTTSGVDANGGNETRPVNVNIMCCIKY